MKISDIADIINVTEKDPSNSGIDVFVGLEHYDIAEPVIKRFGSTKMLTTATKKFETGDVLIARRNVYLQRASVARFSGLTSGDSIILRVKKNLCSEKTDYDTMCQLLPFILNSTNFWDYANTNADGTMSKRLSPAILQEYEFDLPSIKEQKDLAEKLWAAYEVKQACLKMIEATEEMVKSQFIEMFGTSEKNEKKWPKKSFGDKFTITSGGTPDTKNESYWNGNISWIGSNLCQNCLLKENDGKFITKEGLEHSSAKIFKSDTVLVALVGATIGKVAYLQFETATNQNVAGIIVNDKEEFEPMFVYYLLQNMYNRFFMLGMGKFKMASLGFIKGLPLMIPPLALQQQFVSIAQQADKSISELRKSIDAIDKVIKSLINENL